MFLFEPLPLLVLLLVRHRIWVVTIKLGLVPGFIFELWIRLGRVRPASHHCHFLRLPWRRHNKLPPFMSVMVSFLRVVLRMVLISYHNCVPSLVLEFITSTPWPEPLLCPLTLIVWLLITVMVALVVPHIPLSIIVVSISVHFLMVF